MSSGCRLAIGDNSSRDFESDEGNGSAMLKEGRDERSSKRACGKATATEREMKEACEARAKLGNPTEITLASDELSSAARQEEHEPSTMIFLSISKFLLQILDKIGPTMAVLRQDVHRNIERLERIYSLDTSLYSSVGEILKKEVDEGIARKHESCSKAVLWLTRSMNFSLALLQNLEKNPEWNMEQIVEESYKTTLKPWHGWISSAAYKVALKLLPEREVLSSLLMSKGQNCSILKVDIRNLVSLLRPFLDEMDAVLKKLHLDRMKST